MAVSLLENELMLVTHWTYLWLHLIFNVIRDETGLTERILKQIVNAIPATVEQAYEAILSKIRERDKARVQNSSALLL